ncbi:MAG: hypothetical protein M1833_004707 [Piccolia ochrophora]|nr:MAG: hypothetical protein M1833_004707 [Piccolia ochrophora]
MLSNPNSTLHQRQRQHRRQNSTPTAFDAPKVPLLPPGILQRRGSHRRGLSLDQRQQQKQHPPKPHPHPENGTHILREAQQQRIARPGPIEQRPDNQSQLREWEHYPSHFNPNFGFAGDSSHHAHYHNDYDCTNVLSPALVSENPLDAGGYDATVLGLKTSTHSAASLDGQEAACNMGDHDSKSNRNNAIGNVGQQLVQGGFNARAAGQTISQPKPGQAAIAPRTPPSHHASITYPLTPENTPSSRLPQTEPPPRRSRMVDCSQDETIKAPRLGNSQPIRSCMDLFQNTRSNIENNALPSPPITAGAVSSSTFDLAPMPDPSFMDLTSLNMSFSESENGYESSYYSPQSVALSPSQSSWISSPEMEQLQLLENPLATVPNLTTAAGASMLPSSQSAMDLSNPGSPLKGSPVPRSMSIPDLTLDATVEDTGISIDDIACFIRDPDPGDSRWTCLYPDCNKKFGRKENIKSHVQTHLGDRQFRCNYCKKCFVRQHDLKRHAKIHSGVKPYPCQCGNSFARHDALTRHRQRGMCIGAFEGVVRKVVKRGRPRKHRPEADERREKASRTRKHAIAMSTSSSTSGFSVQSTQQGSPPASDDFSSGHSSPLEVLTQGLEMDALDMTRQSFHYTPPTSPGDAAESIVGPQVWHQCSSSPQSPSSGGVARTINETTRNETQLLPSRAPQSTHDSSSQYGTPPELCPSSCSPPPSAFFDMENASGETGMDDSWDSPKDTSPGTDLTLPNINDQVNEMFLDFSNTAGDMSSFDKDPDLLLLEKFGDPFGGDEMFPEDCATSNMFF